MNFPVTPNITLYDPLADLLGAGDGFINYTFEDVVKLSGHACPTVTGAFLMCIHALQALYGEDTPERGGISIMISGTEDHKVNGPISQVFTLLTGAAGKNGFHGLGGQHARNGLLSFSENAAGPFRFTRNDNQASVTVRYDPPAIPPDSELMTLLQQINQGAGDDQIRQQFRELWRDRVVAILNDAGRQTIEVNQQ
jgi:hypothetical protein